MTHDNHVIAFLIGFLSAFALTPFIGRLAMRSRFYAVPVNDRWHTRTVPLLGGVAIVLAFGTALIGSSGMAVVAPVLLCAGLMFVLGLVDDIRPIGPGPKLICQLLVASVVLSTAAPVSITGWPVIDQLLAFIWIIGITNAFNLLDNMDGLAAGVAVVAGVCSLAVLLPQGEGPMTVGLAAFVGAVLGFLVYNYPPAAIFMGDGGSHFLGGFLASASLFAIPGVQSQTIPAALFPVLILLVPIFDTTFVTLTRRLAGRRALVGGRDHVSHRIVAFGASERVAVLSLYLLATVGGGVAIALQRFQGGAAIALVAAYLLGLCVLAVVLGHVRHPEAQDTAENPPLLWEIAYRQRTFELALDIGLLTLAYYGAFRLRFPEGDASQFFPPFVRSLPLVVGAQVAGLYAAGKYRQVWRTLTTPELGTLIKGLLLGITASMMLMLALYRFVGFSRGVFALDALIAFFLLVAARGAASSIDVYLRRRRALGTPALIYGAGRGGALLVRELLQNSDMQIMPVGYIDDDIRKRNLIIEGIPVVGTLEDLASLASRHGASELLVAIRDIDASHLEHVLERTRQVGLTLRRMRFSVDEVRSVPSVLRHER